MTKNSKKPKLCAISKRKSRKWQIGRLEVTFPIVRMRVNVNISEFEPPPIPDCERLPVFNVPESDLERAREDMQIDQNMNP